MGDKEGNKPKSYYNKVSLIIVVRANIGWVLSEISFSEGYIHYLKKHSNNPKELVLSSSPFVQMRKLSLGEAKQPCGTDGRWYKWSHSWRRWLLCKSCTSRISTDTGMQETCEIQRPPCSSLSHGRQGNWGQIKRQDSNLLLLWSCMLSPRKIRNYIINDIVVCSVSICPGNKSSWVLWPDPQSLLSCGLQN